MMLGASAIVWLFLDVKHEELATDPRPRASASTEPPGTPSHPTLVAASEGES